ncbi:DUF7549 family protein [Halorientalis salina]|uniref:DUF7549 family protein n=1 Tax=Halorientalis salina TaxID=2932266 RepID=UPI0010AB9365|nr:hypothetical protein [Halorientalis salina]
MVWVKSELAEELAVVAAWLSAFIPWSVSVALGSIQGGTLVEVRFPLGLVRYLFGIEVTGDASLQNPLLKTPWGAAEFYAGSPGSLPYDLWTLGVVVIAAAVLLSIAMYVFEERLAESAVDPVRLMGGLLLVGAVLLSLSSLVLQLGASFQLGSRSLAADPFPGYVLPIGVLLQYAFAYVLLRVERVEETSADGPATEDTA